jgi:1,4-dihydroxy-6-naphthoate synthase
MELSLGFSSCPNDTYIFYALLHNKINTKGITFVPHLADVEELNHKAGNGELDVTKLSYHNYAYVRDKYAVLHSGSALGFGNGPLLISKHKIYPDELSSVKIAIPGEKTTANLLLSIAFPEAKNKCAYLFSDIEEAILTGEVDAGLIIHENRFTYHKKGLQKITDLGEWWEDYAKGPIPLGGIMIKRDTDVALQKKVDALIRRSIQYAYDHPGDAYDYIKQHAQEMDEQVMYNHIDLYVNKFTLDIGATGKKAIEKLISEGKKSGAFPEYNQPIFIEES